MISKYSIIEAESVEELERMINIALASGAILEGGVGISVSNGQICYAQAITSDQDSDPGACAQQEIDRLVGERVLQYKKYWDEKTGKYRIDVGTPDEWICTEDQLYNDIRKSVIDDIEERHEI